VRMQDICTRVALSCLPALRSTGTSASLLYGTYVPCAMSLWCALSCCHPGALSCKCPPGPECSACTASGICVPLLRDVACRGCGAAGVARRGYALPCLIVLLWLHCLWVGRKCSSASDLVLSQCLWLLSGPPTGFLSLLIHVFASRALVNCNGFSEELHGAGAKAPHSLAQVPLVIRGSPSSWIVKRSLGFHCHETRSPPLQTSEQRHQRNLRSNFFLSSSCSTRHYFNSVAPCWVSSLLRKLLHANI
jgi:hypothetical protein